MLGALGILGILGIIGILGGHEGYGDIRVISEFRYIRIVMDIGGIRASKVIRDVRDSGPNRVRFMVIKISSQH